MAKTATQPTRKTSPLRLDPTRTTTLRLSFVLRMKTKFSRLKRQITKFLVEDDQLGLARREPLVVHAGAFAFVADPAKLAGFNSWLREQVNTGVLEVDRAGEPWTSEYVESAYKTGMGRAYADVHREALAEKLDFYAGSRNQFLRSSFYAPETTDKLRMLYQRAFGELRGVTDTMSQQMSRTLADGLARGDAPLGIARRMTETVDTLERTRARAIARTEIIRAHAEGQLDAFGKLGVEEVGLMAEWSTAGDDLVCSRCGEQAGQLYKVDEAHGLIPLHVNCRCAWTPATEETARADAAGRIEAAPLPEEFELRSGSHWNKRSDEVARPLDNPALPAWAQGRGAPNPIFDSKEDALKSLSGFEDKTLIRSSFPGGIDISKTGAKLSKAVEIPINKLYHSVQDDVYADAIKKYLEVDPEKYKAIEVIYRDGRYMILDGHHRAEAARALGEKFIKAKVWSRESIERITLDKHLLQLTTKIEAGTYQDYGPQLADELARLSKKLPRVAARLKSVDVARTGGMTGLANAGKATDKAWRITLNSGFFGTNAKLDVARGLRLSVKKGWAAGRGKVSEVMTHEFGHLVMRSLPESAKSQIESFWWNEQMFDGGKRLAKAVGKYGVSNAGEMFAEAFVQQQVGKSSAIVKKLMKLARVRQ